MAALTGVKIGALPAGLVTFGQGISPLRTQGGLNNMWVPFQATMSTSYATGGDTFAMPDPSEMAGFEIVGMTLAPNKYGANWYSWNGSQTAPTIQAWSAFNTEVTATTNLSAVTVTGFIFGAR